MSPLRIPQAKRTVTTEVCSKVQEGLAVTSNVLKIATAITTVCAIAAVVAVALRSPANAQASESHYEAQYNASGEMLLPPDNIWRTWVFVGAPLTPNALNNGAASFPEYHNVYIQPWAYEEYKKTNEFPEGTIMFKELQLTLPPPGFKDGSRNEPSGRGYFAGAFNGADVTVKDSKRYAATGNWGYFDFNHFEPKAKMTAAQPKDKCAFCHIASAKKDEVWTQFYRILDQK
jgi:cytochrome P460